jgi:hypothetical protein
MASGYAGGGERAQERLERPGRIEVGGLCVRAHARTGYNAIGYGA